MMAAHAVKPQGCKTSSTLIRYKVYSYRKRKEHNSVSFNFCQLLSEAIPFRENKLLKLLYSTLFALALI